MSNSNYNDKNTARWIVIFFIAIFCAVFFLINSVGIAFAAETGDVMQDLSTLSVDGKAFNVDDYPADETGTPQLIAAYELGYSFYTNKQDDFGLLLYVYNPSQIALTDDKRNAVQLKVGNDARYDKYTLKLIELSADKLFCKFKVNFTDEEKATVLSNVDRDGRRYEISTIEIYESGTNATSYPIERAYVFTGFGKGYGQTDGESTLSSTLNYTEEGGTETVPLNVHHTTWRPSGTVQGPDFGTDDDYGTGGSGGSGSGGGGGSGRGDSNISSKYLQDSISSVYFAVPNEHANKYDYLNSVKCEWYEAVTKPILVTGNAEVYQAVNELIQMQILLAEANEYGVITAPEKFVTVYGEKAFPYTFFGGEHNFFDNNLSWAEMYFIPDYVNPNAYNVTTEAQRLNTLFCNFFTGTIKDVNGELVYKDGSADVTITSDEIKELINNYCKYTGFFNDRKVAGKYPSFLFESYLTEKHVEIIEADKEYTLTGETIKQSLWEKFWNTSHVENQEEYNFDAIVKITDDMVDKDDDIVSNELYITQEDVAEFKEFYKKNKSNSTIYLLRFAKSTYMRMPVMQGKASSGYIQRIDDNAYFAQSTAYLDFDIIWLDYNLKGKSYILPVNMSPIDIFTPLTPPPQEYDFWKYGCGIIAGLIAFYAVYKVANKIIRGVRYGRKLYHFSNRNNNTRDC